MGTDEKTATKPAQHIAVFFNGDKALWAVDANDIASILDTEILAEAEIPASITPDELQALQDYCESKFADEPVDSRTLSADDLGLLTQQFESGADLDQIRLEKDAAALAIATSGLRMWDRETGIQLVISSPPSDMLLTFIEVEGTASAAPGRFN